jgi:citrate lyase beta subunit
LLAARATSTANRRCNSRCIKNQSGERAERFVKPVPVALFVPGIREQVTTKVLESGTKTVIDLEDSVPAAFMAAPRALAAKVIDATIGTDIPPAIVGFVKTAATGFLFDHLDAMFRRGLDTILPAKAENEDDIQVMAPA